jgi:glycosyltransferase involved in cell wall biosynthesis
VSQQESTVRATIIVPFHRNAVHLHACLSAVSQAAPELELIVAADGAIEDCESVARAFAARVIIVPGPAGPAVARNRAASQALGDILIFVDADVVVSTTAIDGMCALLESNPSIAGVFGAYDRAPAAPDFVSQFKNLSHAYVHEVGNTTASTFWAGFGAVRAGAFWSVGGFDERFVRPSVEDIELGCRLVAAGYPLRLDPRFRGTHLKRWTLWNCVTTDIVARGIPWMQLILRVRALPNDLNTSIGLRLSLGLAYGTVIGLMLSGFDARAALAAMAMLGALVAVNQDYYRWLARERGWVFALGVVPMHLLHHLCNGVSLVVGTAMHLAQRAGIALPGALPAARWSAGVPPSATHVRVRT